MGGFSVQPAALTSFASALSGAASGTSSNGLDNEFLITAQDYVNQWVKLEGGTGGMIFSQLVSSMDAVASQINTNYTAISELMGASANGLNTSAALYRSQDHRTAQNLDSIYKPAGVTSLDGDADVSSSNVDPSTTLTPPTDDGGVPDFAQQILDGVGYFSESELVLKILAVCDIHLEDWVKDRFVGDYKAVAKCRNALINLAGFDKVAATAVADGSSSMLKSWQGSAASAAQSYFDQFANGLADHSSTLSSLGQKLDAVVIGIQQAGSTVMGIITGVLDKAIEAAAAVAAAACTEEIPGIDALTDIVGAWKVTQLINKIHELGTVWGYVWGVLQGLMGAIMSFVGMLQNYSAAATLPAEGYANAAQGLQSDEGKATTGRPGPQ